MIRGPHLFSQTLAKGCAVLATPKKNKIIVDFLCEACDMPPHSQAKTRLRMKLWQARLWERRETTTTNPLRKISLRKTPEQTETNPLRTVAALCCVYPYGDIVLWLQKPSEQPQQ